MMQDMSPLCKPRGAANRRTPMACSEDKQSGGLHYTITRHTSHGGWILSARGAQESPELDNGVAG